MGVSVLILNSTHILHASNTHFHPCNPAFLEKENPKKNLFTIIQSPIVCAFKMHSAFFLFFYLFALNNLLIALDFHELLLSIFLYSNVVSSWKKLFLLFLVSPWNNISFEFNFAYEKNFQSDFNFKIKKSAIKLLK